MTEISEQNALCDIGREVKERAAIRRRIQSLNQNLEKAIGAFGYLYFAAPRFREDSDSAIKAVRECEDLGGLQALREQIEEYSRLKLQEADLTQSLVNAGAES